MKKLYALFLLPLAITACSKSEDKAADSALENEQNAAQTGEADMAGQDGASATGADGTKTASSDSAVTQGAFYKDYMKSCVPSSVAEGVPQDFAEDLCGCTATEVTKKVGPSATDVPEAVFNEALQTCSAKMLAEDE